MNKEFLNLIGFESDIITLSNELVALGCEDVCDFGNWDEILDSGSVVVATDECGEEHIEVSFDIVHTAGEDEKAEATIIKVTSVEKF